MDCRNNFVAVRDKGHLHLGETPHILIARVVLRNLKIGELGRVIGVLQRFAVQILISFLHRVRVDNERSEQGKVRLLGADFLGNDGILLVAVLVLLHELPPVGDRLGVRVHIGIIIPVGQGRIEGHAVGDKVVVHDMFTDIGREVQLYIALRHKLDKDIARNVLALEHVGVDVVGLGLGTHLVNGLGLVEVERNCIQAVRAVLFIEQVADFLDPGGNAVNRDITGFGLCRFDQLFLGHVVPRNLVGEILLEGARVPEAVVSAAAVVRRRAAVRRLAVVRRGIISAAAAGRKGEYHCQRQQKG